MRTQQIKVFKFDELNEGTQEKVIERERLINVEGIDWYDFLHEQFKEELEKIGISCKGFFWDFDRGSYIYMDNPSLDNQELFLKSLLSKDEQTLRELEETENDEEVVLNIETNNYGGGCAKNYITSYYSENEYEEKLTEHLNDILNNFLSRIREEYYFLMEEEQIRETLISNDMDFLENGDSW